MANEAIKSAAKKNGVKLWEVAEACGVTDSTFSRQLRKELPTQMKEQVLATIDKLAAAREVK